MDNEIHLTKKTLALSVHLTFFVRHVVAMRFACHSGIHPPEINDADIKFKSHSIAADSTWEFVLGVQIKTSVDLKEWRYYITRRPIPSR